MREIKCRALANNSVDEDMLNTWEVERDGRWIYGTYFSGYILNGAGDGDDDYFTVQGSWCPVIPETLGQFTGMVDMNGKEIYEGDIIFFEPYQTHNNDRIIKFQNGCFVAELIRNGYSEAITCPDMYEVIGNIYENKELMKNEPV